MPVTASRYDAIFRAIEKAHKKRALEQAEETAEMARILCPVSDDNSPGHVHLRDTIRVETDSRTGFAEVIAGDESRGVNHAVVVELGGVFTPPRPYMNPAVEHTRQQYRRKKLKVDLPGGASW